MRPNPPAVRLSRSIGWLIGIICVLWIACDRDDTTPTQTATPASRPTTATAPAPVPADSRDDPAAPRALPSSDDLPGWVKIEPIRVVDPARIDTLITDASVLQAARAYRLDRCAGCTYASPPIRATTLLFELTDSDEAFGLFSVLTRRAGLRPRPEDGMMIEHRRSGDRTTTVGWQGRTCLVLDAAQATGEDHIQSVDLLARRILFSVPASDPPFIMRAIPGAKLANGKVWMVRRTSTLNSTALPALTRIASAGLDDVLGLTGEPRLWIAALGESADPQTPTAEPAFSETLLPSSEHLVWLIRYDDDAAARRAFERYQQHLLAGDADHRRRTILSEPRGPFLAGSWTATAEAAAPLLPTLLDMLPASTNLPETRRPAAPVGTKAAG
ncbi:MAG TPA: hypothetical protein VLM89_01730 [Phycisphaerae bacterium]|nr:hypothetical protein [Phycisphaerae bacterium]